MQLEAVNVCQTRVYIGEVAYVFHTDSLAEIDSVAHDFCRRHVIDANECNRIKRMNKKDCYNINDGEEEKEFPLLSEHSSNQPSSTIVTSASAPSDFHSIDYSTKVGPVLPVFGLSTNTCPHTIMNELNGIIINSPKLGPEAEAALAKACASNTESSVSYKLQTYLNESPQQAVKRFCGMMSLPEYQCKQIRTAFYKLHGISDAVGAYESDGLPEATDIGGDVDYWDHMRRTGRAYVNYVYQVIVMYSEKYAQPLFLLLALIFVGLQVHG